WKDPGFGGANSACMLYVDMNDRRGDEAVWVSLADSLGLTDVPKRGAHNGWKARGDELYTDPITGDAIDIVGTDMQVSANLGQAGSMWDLYNVKSSESLTTGSGSLG